MEPPDWGGIFESSLDGHLMDALRRVPRARWAERERDGETLLFYASRGDNAAAASALIAGGVDVDAPNNLRRLASHIAAESAQPRVLEVLCAARTDLRAVDVFDETPLDAALAHAQRNEACVRVLLANGMRLRWVHEKYCGRITPELEAFERGVLCCRAAVVAMLRVKRAGKLVRWDKFLLAELAVCVWSTRYATGWATRLD